MAYRRLPYIQDIDRLTAIPPEERLRLKEVGQKFKFRTNEYYNALINWDDPNDPLRLLVVPHESELDEDYGTLDASGEADHTRVRGLQHKYRKTALLLVSKVCAAYCRFCFRKRLFSNDNDETTHDITECVAYIREHEEIESVVLSGGDPMLLSTSALSRILSDLATVPHVKTVRIDTKILAFNPFRIIDDPGLAEMIGTYSRTSGVRVYFIAHYTHPRELAPESIQALKLVQDVGIGVYNQMPLMKGINSDAAVVAELLSRLVHLGVTPYYVFIPRPVSGSKRFALPLRQAWEIYTEAIGRCTGLGRTARLMMSHRSGKIEVVGYAGDQIVLRYHQAPDPAMQGTVVVVRTKGDEMWTDDLDLPSHNAADADERVPRSTGGTAELVQAAEVAQPIRAAALRAAEWFPWYRDLLGPAFTVPLLTQETLDRFYYTAPPRAGTAAYYTSGSATGKRRRIEYSQGDQERYLETKRNVFGHFLKTRRYPVHRVVSDVGTGHAADTASDVFRGLGVQHRSVSYDRPIHEHLAVLYEQRPQVLYTMPSILEALLRHASDPKQLGIKGLILVGECAGPAWINSVVAGRLGIDAADVMDTYGSIEIGLIAHYSHERECYVVADDIVAETVSPEDVGLHEDLREDEAILVVTSRARDAFPAVRFVTYDVVRGFRGGSSGAPATFQAIVRRVGGEFKHGEKISLNDIESVVYRHLDDATVRVRTDDRRLRVLIHSDQMSDDVRRRINDEIEQSIPEIAVMIAQALLVGVEVLPVPFDQLVASPERPKQRISR